MTFSSYDERTIYLFPPFLPYAMISFSYQGESPITFDSAGSFVNDIICPHNCYPCVCPCICPFTDIGQITIALPTYGENLVYEKKIDNLI